MTVVIFVQHLVYVAMEVGARNQSNISTVSQYHPLPTKSGSVNNEERTILKDALSELQGGLACHTFGYWYEFSKEQVSDVVAACHKLFTLNDIISSVPVYSKDHAVRILEVLSEIFNDIDEDSLSDSLITFSEDFFTGFE